MSKKITIKKPVASVIETKAPELLQPLNHPLYDSLKKNPNIGPKVLKEIMQLLRTSDLATVNDATLCVQLIFTKMFPNMKGWQ
jgi:hypothetical protein